MSKKPTTAHASRLLYKNIAASFVYKAINIATQFVLVRVTLQTIDVASYGVWLTISSVLLWLSIFDFGFTNGLRNKVTQLYADRDYSGAQTYVSTAYAFLSITAIGIFVFFSGIAAFMNWQVLFNAPLFLASTLPLILIISFGLFCIRLILNLIVAVLYAVHQAGIVELINMSIQVATLAILCLGLSVEHLSLLKVAIIYSLAPVVVFIIYSLVLYNSTYYTLRPSWRLVNWSLFRELGSISGKFFGLQLVSLVLFTSQNFIISRLFSPAEVTPFNLAYRYFSVIHILYNLIIVPHWSAITEAQHRQDMGWIRKKLNQLLIIWLGFVLVAGLLVGLSDQVYDLWLGKNHIPISFLLTVVLGINAIIMAWSSLFALIVNSLGAITLQLITALIVLVISIPLAVYLSRQPEWGVVGVPIAFTLCLLPGSLILPYQCYRLLNRKVGGIWTK